MPKEPAIEMEGIVVESLPNAEFIVEILPPTAASDGDDSEEGEASEQPAPVPTPGQEANKHLVRARISGKMRMHYIKINPGDKVTVEISPYDPTRGRITYRNK